MKKLKLRQLTSDQLLQINRAFNTDKATPKEIAAMFNISQSLVYRVIKGFSTKTGYCEAL